MAWQKPHKRSVWVGASVVVGAIFIDQLASLLILLGPEGDLDAIRPYLIIRGTAWGAAFLGILEAFIGVVSHWRATAGVSRSSWVCSLAAILVAHAAFIAMWLGERPYFDYLETLISASHPDIRLLPTFRIYGLMQQAAAYSSAFIALMLARHHWHWFTLGSVLPLGWMVFRFCASLFGS